MTKKVSQSKALRNLFCKCGWPFVPHREILKWFLLNQAWTPDSFLEEITGGFS